MHYRWQTKWMETSLCLFLIISFHQKTIVTCEIIYNELIQLNATCVNLDSCQGNRTTDDLRVVNCQCGPICAQLDTCCADSEYRTLKVDNADSRVKPTGIQGNEDRLVFMVSDCKPDWDDDQEIEDLCDVPTEEAYSDGDLFPLIPVTNLRNGITYRNYYCFACNEDESSDSPVLWDLLLYNEDNITVGSNPDLRYVEEKDDYYVNDDWVHITVGEPSEISSQVNWYRQDVISTCDEEWTDVTIKEKCTEYTAMVYVHGEPWFTLYKNPHCAICNHKKVSDLVCTEPIEYMINGGIIPYGFLLSGIFSFEDKVQRCARNEVFDKFSKKCRAFRCGRNQKMANGKCKRNAEPSKTSSSRQSTTFPGTQRSGQIDNLEWTSDSVASTVKVTPELPETPLPTQSPITTRNPRLGYQGGIRGPITSTGRDRPRPPNITSSRSGSSHSIIIENHPQSIPVHKNGHISH